MMRATRFTQSSKLDVPRRHSGRMHPHGLAALALLAAAPACRLQAAGVGAPAEGFLTGAAGARIFYQVAGSGRDTVVVVHGGPGAGINDVRPDVEPLTKSHVVIFYDQRGGGRSDLPKDTTHLGPRYFTGDLEAVRTHFHLDRMTLVAVSFGAIVVAEYARAHPDRVARMVFLAATGPSRKEAARFYGRPPATSDTALARRRFELLRTLMEGRAADPVAACREEEQLSRELARAAGEFAGRKGTACNMPAPAVRYYYQYTARLGPELFGSWDYTRSLGRVSAPVLVIDGERDTLGLPMERAWTRALPNARLLIIRDAGRAVHAERPDAVFPAIDEFLSGRWPEGARPSTSVR
jgi:proline iminopeptidase